MLGNPQCCLRCVDLLIIKIIIISVFNGIISQHAVWVTVYQFCVHQWLDKFGIYAKVSMQKLLQIRKSNKCSKNQSVTVLMRRNYYFIARSLIFSINKSAQCHFILRTTLLQLNAVLEFPVLESSPCQIPVYGLARCVRGARQL